MLTTAMTLGNWDIHGLALAIHLLLEYTGSNYEERKYMMGDISTCMKSCRFLPGLLFLKAAIWGNK
uniref:GST N-terminal domain-containing protein n=1 Tax=Catagonus wagneri TaxID=51154 RepID=A0A8C4FFS0_9CETA